MDAVATEITAAKAKLSSGETYINKSTAGDNVAANYGSYGNVVMDGAGHRANEAIARLREVESILTKYSGEVTSFGSETNAYANEVSGLLGGYREEVNAYNGEATGLIAKYQQEVNAYTTEVNGLLNKYQGQVSAEIAGINDFQARIAKYQQQLITQTLKTDKYRGEVSSYGEQINAERLKIQKYTEDINKYQAELQETILTLKLFEDEINFYQAQINESGGEIAAFGAKVDKIVNYATQLGAQVNNNFNIAGRYLASGQAKINEMLAALGYKVEFQTQRALAEQRS
jgi:chromosome segregation ATPase